MEIIREEEKLVLKNESEVIEEYNFKDNIDLKKLIEKLLNDNLTNKYEVKENLGDKSQEEENLINVIKGIVSDYNNKVDDYQEFIKKEENLESK